MRTFLIVLLLFANTTYGQSIKGKVMDVKRNRPISMATITLVSKDGARLLEITNEKGDFEFNKVVPNQYQLTFSSFGYKDSIFMNFELKKDTTINLIYVRNCPYDESINNRICPKCRKKNSVIPILYGLPLSVNGKNPTKGNGKKFILGGCEISDCDPNWFCKRDKISF